MVEVTDKGAATDKSQASCEFSDSESWSSHQKEVTVKPVASRNSGNLESSKAGSRKWPHNFHSLQHQYLTWRKSTRSHERFMAKVQQMNWMTSTWTTLYEVCSWMLHFKPQFILVETFWAIYDLPRISSWSQWNSYSKRLKSWSWIRQKSVVWPRLIIKNLRGNRRLYCVTQRSRLRMPKPMSSPTECSEWEVSVTNQSKPGKTKSNGIWNSLSQRSESNSLRANGIRVEIFPGFPTMGILEEIQKYMIELQCEPEQFEGRIIFMSMYNDIIWENKETQKNVRRILLQLRIMLADSRSDVGHFWNLDQRRNGTELILINQMENGTRLLNEWCSILQKAVILSFVPPAPWKEAN